MLSEGRLKICEEKLGFNRCSFLKVAARRPKPLSSDDDAVEKHIKCAKIWPFVIKDKEHKMTENERLLNELKYLKGKIII